MPEYSLASIFRGMPILRVLGMGLLSVVFAQCLYWRWPSSVSFDVTFSLFAAQNRIVHGEYKTIEPNNAFDEDLANIKTQWLNTWPPFVTFVYAALLASEMTPGSATSLIVFILSLFGTMGWVFWARSVGAAEKCQLFLAATIPWMSFPVFAFTCLYNDHFIWAIAPWTYISITRLSNTDSSTKDRKMFWLKSLIAGLFSGMLVTIKYSAFPLLIGAGVYFLIRDGYFITLRKGAQALWFAFWLIVPGLIVYFVNRSYTGQATAVTRKGVQFTSIGLAQVLNLIYPPVVEIFGIAQAFSNLKKVISVSQLFIAGIAVIFIFSMLYFAVSLGRRSCGLAAVKHLVSVTFAMWGFLLLCTILFGYYFDWTSETRYYIPIYFGWYIALIVALFNNGFPAFLRVLLAICCIGTVSASVIAGVAKPLVKTPPSALSISKLAVSAEEFREYQVITQKIAETEAGNLPVLFIAESTFPMIETGVPAVPWMYFEMKERIYSSKPNVVWIYLPKNESAKMISKIDASAKITHVNLPEHSLGEFLIIQFL